MKIFTSIASGALRSLKSWKCILIVWFVTLLVVSFYVLPAKSIMKSGFGSSMVTELLAEGINIEALADLGPYLQSLISYLVPGIFFMALLGILINTFFAGGLFKCVKDPELVLSVPCFFRASGKYFWYFLGLYLIITIMILISGLLVAGLPTGLVYQMDPSSGLMPIVGIISIVLLLIVFIIFILVADYSRAWLIAAEKPAFFKALGFGFSQTFSHFWSSFPMMLIVMIVTALLTWLFTRITAFWIPSEAGGVFLLWIISQLLIIVRILLKTWRYGSVTALIESQTKI